MTAMFWWWLVAVGVARADRLVVYEGDPVLAVNRVSLASGAAVFTLDPIDLPALAPSSAPRFVPGPSPSACGGPASTNADLRESLSAATATYLDQEWTESALGVNAALDRLNCLGEPAEASVATDLYFLRGLLAQARKEDSVCIWFQGARRFSPNKPWDDSRFGNSPDGKPEYEACAALEAKLGPSTVSLAPGALSGGTLWVDGRPAEAADGQLLLSTGRHIVQLLGSTVTTWVLDAAPAEHPLLVSGAGLSSTTLGAAIGSPWFTTLLGAKSVNEAAYAYVGGTVWELSGGKWKELNIPTPPDPLREAAIRAGLRSGGLAVGLSGTALCLLAWRQTELLSKRPSWEQTTDQSDYIDRGAEVWRRVAWASGGAALGGLGVAGASWAVGSSLTSVATGPGVLSVSLRR